MSYPVPTTRIKTDVRPTAPAPVKAGSLILAGSNVKAVQHLVNFMKGKENGTAFMQAHPWFAMGIRVFTYAACIFTGIVPMFLAAYLIDRVDNRQAASKNSALNQKMKNVFNTINRKNKFIPPSEMPKDTISITCDEVIKRADYPAKHAAAKKALKDLALNIDQKIGNAPLETYIPKSEDAINLFASKAKTSNIQDPSIDYAVDELRLRLFKGMLKSAGENYAESIVNDEDLNSIIQDLHNYASKKDISMSPEAIKNAILYYAQKSEGLVNLEAKRESLKALILDLENNAEHPIILEKENVLANKLQGLKDTLGQASVSFAPGTIGYKLRLASNECQRLEQKIAELNIEKQPLMAQLISAAKNHATDLNILDFSKLATNENAFIAVLSNLEKKKPDTTGLAGFLTLVKQIEETNKLLTRAQGHQANIIKEFHAHNKAIMETQKELEAFKSHGHSALRNERIAPIQTQLNKVELLINAKPLKAFESELSRPESSSESDNSDHESISEMNFDVKIQNEEAPPVVISSLFLDEKDAVSALRGTLKGFILKNSKGTSTPSSGTRVEELDDSSDGESVYASPLNSSTLSLEELSARLERLKVTN